MKPHDTVEQVGRAADLKATHLFNIYKLVDTPGYTYTEEGPISLLALSLLRFLDSTFQGNSLRI